MQAPDEIATLNGLDLTDVLARLSTHSVAAVVTLGYCVLLFRVSNGTKNSRFLRHLSASLLCNVVFRLGSIVALLLTVGTKYIASARTTPVDVVANAKVAAWSATIASTWHAIDVTISLLATSFLFTTWNLLKVYPSQSIDKRLFQGLTGIFGIGSFGVLLQILDMVGPSTINIWRLIDIIDVAAATIGLLLVGWQLSKLGNDLGSKRAPGRSAARALSGMTLLAYMMWGMAQPFYPWLKDKVWYSSLLLLSGFFAMFMTIQLCAQVLEDKPREVGSA